ncbi:hypothetical protein [Draconibacterium halophilum]|uniref:DUF4402 domain-containing protein n=1 Tax=Draconibacterium halophilum TaxID=2706887 RepID=A0A6C0RIV8_9BACT|nr:hypothetical protein [Draconibacterium halophilum]QIA09782.1 hypothetical protein G0Q07_19655 [Draconibacterium halophilum]
MKFLLIIGLLACSFVPKAQVMEVLVDGTIDFDQNSFTISDAGADFPNSIESESSLYLSVLSGDEWDKKLNPNRKWKLEVRKEDLIWDEEIQLEIVRAGDGYGNKNKHNKSKIYDGTNYQRIENISSYFFRGKGQITEIPIQIRLSGLSIVHGAKDYETNVILTVYDD